MKKEGNKQSKSLKENAILLNRERCNSSLNCDRQLETHPRLLPCNQRTWTKPSLWAVLPILQSGMAQDILLLNTEVTERSYLASLVLSLSSFPHSQSFPGSTAKYKGSNLCSESVRGITAKVEKKQGFWWGGEQKRLKKWFSCEKQHNWLKKKGRIWVCCRTVSSRAPQMIYIRLHFPILMFVQ